VEFYFGRLEKQREKTGEGEEKMQSGTRFKEYMIRTAPTAQKIQVARLIVPDAVAEPKDLSQWPKPVRLTREDTDVKEGNPVPVPVDKERFRALLSDDQHKGRARMRHMPLNLEDSSKELNFQARIGKSSEGEFLGLDKGGFEAPQTAHYFLFVLEVAKSLGYFYLIYVLSFRAMNLKFILLGTGLTLNQGLNITRLALKRLKKR